MREDIFEIKKVSASHLNTKELEVLWPYGGNTDGDCGQGHNKLGRRGRHQHPAQEAGTLQGEKRGVLVGTG